MSSVSKNFNEYDDIRVALKETILKVESEYIHLIPPLPDWCNKTYLINDNGIEYSINIYNLTCTCNEFKEKLELYTPREVRSLCSHLRYKISNTKIAEYLDEVTSLLVKETASASKIKYYSYEIAGRQIIIGLNKTQWVKVFTKAKRNKADPEGNFTKYSYNLKQGRWSYNISPYPKNLIIEAIKLSLSQIAKPIG